MNIFHICLHYNCLLAVCLQFLASGMTGLSGASDKTYIAEESSLVLECREKNQIK